MSKRKNLDKAADGLENPFFVHENANSNHIYIVDMEEFDNAEPADIIMAQVLEYMESEDELIYYRKKPELIIPLKKSLISGLLLS